MSKSLKEILSTPIKDTTVSEIRLFWGCICFL